MRVDWLGRRAADVDDLVETSVAEDIVGLRAGVDQLQFRTQAFEPLLRQQEDPQSRAGDIFKPPEVDDLQLRDAVQELELSVAWGGPEPPCHHDFPCRSHLDLEHACPPAATV